MDIVLRVKKRRQNEWPIYFILVLTLFYGVIDLIDISAIKYTLDIAWIFLLLTLITNRFRLPNDESKGLFGCIVAFLGATLIGFALNSWNLMYYLWGFRNNFRFFVFFLACIKFIDARNIDDYLQLMNKAFYLHFVVAMIQYFVFGLKRDHLGGIFGTQMGNNGFSLAFMMIIITYSILSYLNHREKMWVFMAKGMMAILIAVFSELKFFFVMCILIGTLCILVTRFSYKKLIVILLSAVGVDFGAVWLAQIFQNWTGWFDWKSMLELASSNKGYTGSGDLNRLTAVSSVWNMFLDSWDKKLFGLGLGNCDNAAFNFLTTDFFRRYNHLHYNWFSSAFTILETGIVGLAIYLLFFMQVFVAAHRQDRARATDVLYCQLAKVMAIVALVLIVYNASMRTEAGYMVYFVLALPFMETYR